MWVSLICVLLSEVKIISLCSSSTLFHFNIQKKSPIYEVHEVTTWVNYTQPTGLPNALNLLPRINLLGESLLWTDFLESALDLGERAGAAWRAHLHICREASQLSSCSSAALRWQPTSANTDTQAAGKPEAPSTETPLCRQQSGLHAGEATQWVPSRALPRSVLILHPPWKGAENACARSQGPPRLTLHFSQGHAALNRIWRVKDEAYAFSPPLILFNFHRFLLSVLGGGPDVFLFPDCFWMT